MKKIEDFGNKIGGARKDAWATRGLNLKDISTFSDEEKTRYIDKQNVWIKPDYQKLVDEGKDKLIVYFMKVCRDSLPTRPVFNTTQGQTNFIEFLSDIKSMSENINNRDEILTFFDKVVEKYCEVSYSSARRIKYRVVGSATNVITNKFFKAIQVKNLSSLEKEMNDKKFLYTKEDKILKDYIILKNDEKCSFTEEAWGMTCIEVSDVLRTHHYFPENLNFEDVDSFEKGTFFVLWKKGYSVVVKNAKTYDDAKKQVLALNQNNSTTKKDRKGNFLPPELASCKRVGNTYTNGAVKTDNMLNVFGFYGGEFGNWVSKEERQVNLDMSYEAFCDLACALDISTKDISLGGKLSIAYGARGHGSALAHFESDRNVINLTRMKGAGSLAHEWGHALDHFLGKAFCVGANSLSTLPVCEEIVKAMTFKKDNSLTDYYKASIEFDKKYSKKGHNDYWSSSKEMFARAFSCYVKDKLEEKGIVNDYLCAHSDCYSTKLSDGITIYAYPVGEERKIINAKFDELIEYVKKEKTFGSFDINEAILFKKTTKKVVEEEKVSIEPVQLALF